MALLRFQMWAKDPYVTAGSHPHMIIRKFDPHKSLGLKWKKRLQKSGKGLQRSCLSVQGMGAQTSVSVEG